MKNRNTITKKMLGIVGVWLLLTLSVFIYYIENQSYQYQIEQLKEQQALITEGQSILLSDQLSEGQEDAAFLTLSGILANPLIVGVALNYLDETEDLIIGDVSGALTFTEPVPTLTEELDILDRAELTTFASTKYIELAIKKRLGHQVGLIFILLVTILALIAICLKKTVGNPLSLIVTAIERSSIDEAPRIEWESSDEMGAVVERLNALHENQKQLVVGLKRELNDTEIREIERLRNLADASFEAILIFRGNRVLDANKPMLEMLGQSLESIQKKSIQDLLDSSTLNEINASHQLNKTGRNTTLILPTGVELPIELYVSDFKYGSVDAKVAVVRDITEQLAAESKLLYMANHDGLTGLLNRSAFISKFETYLKQVHEDNAVLAVMYLDLDNFKEINDVYGHDEGDKLLQSVAHNIAQGIQVNHFIARLGGDEFSIVLTADTIAAMELEASTQSIISAIESCKEECKVGLDFGVSIGVSIQDPCEDLSSAELLSRADFALYSAKNDGRNKACFYSDELDKTRQRQIYFTKKLIHAIDNDQLEMFYQPQVLAEDQSLIGFEALLRWHDEEFGWVSPSDIIDAAQKENITFKLTQWVLRSVCQEAVHWPSQFCVAVNLAPADLMDERLCEYLAALLAETGMPPERLEIEVTESAIITDLGFASKALGKFKSMGLTIALDDFGTGFSSLSLLQNLPFDRIKLDKSFVNTHDKASEKIANAIIDLGRELEVEVVAEGVETHEQWLKLRHKGCHIIQGYYISAAVPACDLKPFFDCPEMDVYQGEPAA